MILMSFTPWCHSSDWLRATERLHGWNKSNYTSASKAKDFIWLVVEWMSERSKAQERLDTPLLDLKMEGAPWEGMWVPSRNGVWPPADKQQGNSNLRSTTTRNWAQPTTWMSVEVDLSQSHQTRTQLTFYSTLFQPEQRTQPSLLSLMIIVYPARENLYVNPWTTSSYHKAWQLPVHLSSSLSRPRNLLTHLVRLAQGQTQRCTVDVSEMNEFTH